MKDLAVYIHIPFCVKKCEYCNFYSITDYAFEDKYCDCVIRQLENEVENFSDYSVKSVYFGGGTPSSLKTENIGNIFSFIKSNYNFSECAEVSIECNPNSLTYSNAEQYLSYGINRFSVGIQSTDEETLKMLGRQHSVSDCRNALKILKDLNAGNINADYILGTLSKNFDDEKRFVDFVCEYNIPHVSAYALKLEDNTPLLNKVKKNIVILNDEDTQVDEYNYLLNELSKIGIQRYETSNFAKPGFECRHNLSYWNLTEYLGVGTKAHSFHHNKRISVENNVCDYAEALSKGKQLNFNVEEDGEESRMFEYVMLSLRTRYGISFARFEELFSKNFFDIYGDKINKNKQFFNISNECVSVKDEYFYVLDSILLKIL